MGNNKKITIPIKHNITPYKNALGAALLPIGYFLHREIQECPIGSLLQFYDGVGELVCRTEIRAPSEMADTLCQMLYGKGRNSERIMKTLYSNWDREMYENKLLFIIFNNKTK